jgi:hypothetical protein
VNLEEQPRPEDLRVSDVPLLAQLFGNDLSQANEDAVAAPDSKASDSRASHAPLTEPELTQDIDLMVGVTGFEPATYTSRT